MARAAISARCSTSGQEEGTADRTPHPSARRVARVITLTYGWVEISALVVCVALVLSVLPFVGALLIGSGTFSGWWLVGAAALVTLPFSVPVAYLSSRWVLRMAASAYPMPSRFRPQGGL